MAVTRNDWDIIDSYSSSRLVPLRWITGKVRSGDAHTILDHLGERFNREVEPINKSESWGYAQRDVRGNKGIVSEHNSGTAVDFNATKHPIGRRNTFSKEKQAAIRKIVRELDGAIRWGGEWARADDMHFELIGGVKKLKQVADKIKASGGSVKPSGDIGKPTTPKPPAKPSNTPSKAVQDKLRGMQLPPTLAGVVAFQKQHNLVEDGVWGNLTEAKYQYNVRLQNALKKMKGVPKTGWKSDGYTGTTTNKWKNYTLKRQGWTNANLVANLKRVGAW